MGQLVAGRWVEGRVDATVDAKGRFVRQSSAFHGRLGSEDFPVEPGRYHLYAQWACPWSQRAMIVRKLKGLDGLVGFSSPHPHMLEGGWHFSDDDPDAVEGVHFVHELYTLAEPDYTGKVTVPVLWDKQRRTIVNNESSEIVRMLAHAFDGLGADPIDPYPQELAAEIDAFAQSFYDTVNNGVYRCGFARSQEAYEEAFDALFQDLDRLERHLDGREWLVGDRLTLADVHLWPTLVRFDAVYVTHFKCNLRRLTEYPNLQAYTERLYAIPAFRETTSLHQIKQHYYVSHPTLNPKGIVPKGFQVPFE